MEINQDFVPATIKAAVEHIVASLNSDEVSVIKDDAAMATKAHHNVGQYLRNGWSLWDNDTPLKRDAVSTYRIAHADDISGLMLDWVCALVREEAFDPVEACESYHDHWRRYGTTALEAGGWKADGSGPLR